MSQKIAAVGVQKERGFLYFVDKQGDISRTPMARGKKGNLGNQKVAIVGVTKEPGYLYCVDRDGDISRSKLQRGRR